MNHKIINKKNILEKFRKYHKNNKFGIKIGNENNIPT